MNKFEFNELGKTYKGTGKLLFLDLETTGLPISWNIPPKRHEHWPRIVEVAYIITDYEGNEIENYRQIVKPEGWTIPTASVRIHKITNKIAEKEGINIMNILEDIAYVMSDADLFIAHNTEFDLQVLEAEFYRYDMDVSVIKQMYSFCTMKNFTDYCAIPSRRGYDDYKYPKLDELNRKVFGVSIPQAHSALSDVYAVMFCFFALKKKKVFSLETAKQRQRRLKKTEMEVFNIELIKKRKEYEYSTLYKTEYEKMYLTFNAELKGISEDDLLQKVKTKRSNVSGRKSTIKKMTDLLKAEENTDKATHLLEKLNRKYDELNTLITEIEVLDHLRKKRKKSWSGHSNYNEKTNTSNNSPDIIFIFYFILIILALYFFFSNI